MDCGCESHVDYNVQMTGTSVVISTNILILGAFKNNSIVYYQYEQWQDPICDRITLNMMCPLKLIPTITRAGHCFYPHPPVNHGNS
jgi:hypothetical protein